MTIAQDIGLRQAIIASVVSGNVIAVEQAAAGLSDRRKFYWRVIGYCVTRIANRGSAFHMPLLGDVEETMCVILAINVIERSIEDRRLDYSEKMLVFKMLFRAFSDHVCSLEENSTDPISMPPNGRF